MRPRWAGGGTRVAGPAGTWTEASQERDAGPGPAAVVREVRLDGPEDEQVWVQLTLCWE